MKSTRLNYAPKDNASKAHVKVLTLLRSIFPQHQIYQEYPYDKILLRAYKINNTPYEMQDQHLLRRGRILHADIYDKTLNVIYEVQGQHHYKPVIRDKRQTEKEIQLSFAAQKRNDKTKRRIANEGEITLLEIPYMDFDKLDDNYIWTILNN